MTACSSAWTDFLANYDDGTPVIFIGHSQGSIMLIKLLEAQIDPNPTLRNLMVTAIIAGGNVTVPTGKTEGATFQNLPLCTASDLSGASSPTRRSRRSLRPMPTSASPARASASTPDRRPPPVSRWPVSTRPTSAEGRPDLKTYWPLSTPLPIPSMAPPAPAVTTPWIYYPNQYTATCETAGTATWLQVTPSGRRRTPGRVVTRSPDLRGVTTSRTSTSLGNLVTDVHNAEVAYSG